MTITGDRLKAIERRRACDSHKIDAEDNNWCRSCDTGECSDCLLDVFYSSVDEWYHHLTAAASCFLLPSEPDNA